MKKPLAALVLFLFLWPNFAVAAPLREIAFPVQGDRTFGDDYNSPRSGGRTHRAIDIIAPKMTHALAAADGYVSEITVTEPSYGWLMRIRDAEGYEYEYIHLNNDTPGTDDGKGGYANAFAPGIALGARVAKGQHVAYVGDSGNAEGVGSHLHFAMYDPAGASINPYASLVKAASSAKAAPKGAASNQPSISAELGLKAAATVSAACPPGELAKTAKSSAVYYCGDDGKRYVFPDENTYFTWYDGFSGVKTISEKDMAAMGIGGNVTYRPGSRLLKIPSDPRVYAVETGGVLREISSPSAAARLFGADWSAKVNDLSEAFFADYIIGEPIV